MKAEDVSKVAIVGAGTMGSVMAGEFARAGCRVRLTDVAEEAVERGFHLLDGAQQALVDSGLVSGRAAAAARRRVTGSSDLADACDDVDLLVEAVSEDLALKQRLFRRFDKLCPRRTILASNTSGLSITAISKATRRPTKVAGLHFWNPPHIIPLVEVTRGSRTSAQTATVLRDVCHRMGKQPILVKHDVPGFVGNRLQFAVMREALHLLEEGIASAEDIDTAMTAGPGLRYGLLGPLRTADLGGLDIFLAISRYLFAELDARKTAPPALKARVGRGDLGSKSGRGFYAYDGSDRDRILRRRDRILLEFLKVLRDNP